MPPFRFGHTVRFADVDHAGIVYYPVFFHYFHLAFEEMFRARLGARAYVDLLDKRQLGFPAVKAACEYTAPLRFGDDVEISLATAAVGGKSVTFNYSAVRPSDAVTAATGEIVCAVVDLSRFRAVPIPDDLCRLFLELTDEP